MVRDRQAHDARADDDDLGVVSDRLAARSLVVVGEPAKRLRVERRVRRERSLTLRDRAAIVEGDALRVGVDAAAARTIASGAHASHSFTLPRDGCA